MSRMSSEACAFRELMGLTAALNFMDVPAVVDRSRLLSGKRASWLDVVTINTHAAAQVSRSR
jgi:hypothetical protein